ncbi:hypothetical protein [Rouxiella badensis]|jgi:hypothetical protein|uniref:hypothetical protein n=1 Tax=Rouxiella badensis TaxID=1646377 RepID=UPI0003804004|nr:hypothetical protein [Rouxiella badensis]MCC3703615.1 hypothetical protein [Rouxiella badensis]MCC3720580.1 hypothetical protein [Rouxiella badensis]MCC3730419.1 hypothetical protein [Rouxiella badensis]MCC3734463.1 hypothetical protein [Rouxiella badensis]MCC3742745.1 hypothetical protein [Rouxiella badensis]
MAGQYSPQEIADTLNRTKAALMAFASRNGIYFSRGPNNQHTQASVNEVVRLKGEGKSYRQIVAITGVPISTCAYWCRRQHEAKLVSTR